MSGFEEMRAWGRAIMSGDKVRFRAINPEDRPILALWWSDAGEAILQQERIALLPAERIGATFDAWSSNDSPAGAGFAVVDGDEHLIGHVTIWGITVPTRIATLAIIIGPDFQNRGYGRDAMGVALRFAFQEMGAHKVEVQAWDYNDRAVRLYKSLGFVEEGRRRAAAFHQSRFHSQVQLGLLFDEYAARVAAQTVNSAGRA
ncbi:GNAT family N-acetyltransferase [Rathayibacter agropyri]|uniref:GNAT family N-acetyltransferase n=1 Tax=Rathayibacter agropyri TaxID=1634927 RepID=UPI0015658A3D|nr:GNAT family protein [Rathayibacter agropyri]NRD08349.1 GNAT family N-acetyltransferase [Rathayibacter agropyri]